MQSSETEERVVPMTEADIALSEKAIEEAYEKIGEIAVKKAKANAIASADTKAETKIVDRETKKLETGEHRVACYVEKDLHEGKARYYRADTLLWVYTRDLENWERQQPLTFETGPATNTASEAAKAKSPGLKEQEKTEVSHGMANEPLVPVVAPPAVPDEIRAAVVEAGVPDDMVENAIGAIRDGADPKTVIANATRDTKPAKEAKKKGKKAAEQTPEEKARVSLADEMKALLGHDIGIAVTFAIVDGMERAEAVAKGEAIKALIDLDPKLVPARGLLLEDVFDEQLSVEDAATNARAYLKKNTPPEAAQ